MTIQLPPEIEQFIADEVRRGEHASPDEAIRAIFDEAKRRSEKRDELRRMIAEGIVSADRGELRPVNSVELLAEIRRRKLNVEALP